MVLIIHMWPISRRYLHVSLEEFFQPGIWLAGGTVASQLDVTYEIRLK